MKVSRTLTFLICLMVFSSAWADAVNENAARAIAQNFMSANVRPVTAVRLAHKAPSQDVSGTSAYYVFNADRADGGYVIVAGDDRVPAVLGYSDNGTFDWNDIPEALQDWLDGYADQIAAIGEDTEIATHIGASRPIAPLMRAQWSQNSPYNILFPTLSDGSKAVVGCVATAMAQVMYYWKWPVRPSMDLPAYVTETSSLSMPSLPVVDFNWSAMCDTYLTDDVSSVAARAASQLSLYCAQSVEMDFDKNSSSASTFDVPMAMKRFFDYSPKVKSLQRRFYTSEQWENVILEELTARRPVIYRGRKASGGHAFVCDGFDGNGRFHINWGWNGRGNGYFLLSVLNPDLQGTGSASGAYGYICDQAIIAGIQPRPQSSGNPELEVFNKFVEVKEYTGTRTSSSQDFTVTQESHFLNCSDGEIAFDYAWGLYRGNSLVKVMEAGNKESLSSWYYFRPTRTLSFGGGITSGTFHIIPIYSKPYANDWKQCNGADINYIEVAISGNNCTVIGHGVSTTPVYQLNNVRSDGTMHKGRPVDFTLDLTNKGYTRNDVIYVYEGTELVSMGFIDVGQNERGLVTIRYVPKTIGTKTLKFTLDEDGTNILATETIFISNMPSAKVTGSALVTNLSDFGNRIINDKEFVVQVRVTNSGTATYDEDISVKLYKSVYGNTGTMVQAFDQRVTLAPNASTNLVFHFDNVVDGWKYFCMAFYYSNGDQIDFTGVNTCTVIFPNTVVRGDVNKDGEVSIADVNAVIDFIQRGIQNPDGDVNGDGEVSIADINTVIDLILGS